MLPSVTAQISHRSLSVTYFVPHIVMRALEKLKRGSSGSVVISEVTTQTSILVCEQPCLVQSVRMLLDLLLTDYLDLLPVFIYSILPW